MSEFKIDDFGGCPQCGKNSGYVNAGSTHVFYCEAHKVSWIYGADIFDDWLSETEAEQIDKYRLIEDFERVAPLWPEDAHVVFGRGRRAASATAEGVRMGEALERGREADGDE
jgi:hypothetical protein